MRLLVALDGDRAKRELALRQDRLGDLPHLYRRLADVVRDASAQQFRAGTGWAAPKGGGRPLVDTGTLRDSLTRAGARYQRVSVVDDSVTVETTVPYAEFLKQGTRGAPSRDPSRVDESALRRAAAAMLLDYLLGG